LLLLRCVSLARVRGRDFFQRDTDLVADADDSLCLLVRILVELHVLRATNEDAHLVVVNLVNSYRFRLVMMQSSSFR